MEQVSVQFGDMLPFLRRDDIGSAATISKLMTFLLILRKRRYLKWSLQL